MNRAEHLQWCKDRALEILDNGGTSTEAFASFGSDMNKHDETREHVAMQMGIVGLMGGLYQDPEEMRNFINGFN